MHTIYYCALLVLVLDTEEQTAVTDFELRVYRNCPKNLAVPPDVMAVHVLEYPPYLEASVDGLEAISCTGLHPLVFHRITWVVRALDLVGSADIAVIGLDLLTGGVNPAVLSR